MVNDKQPVYILPENIHRIIGRDAQRNNILAARVLADSVKTTLGPKGMDKMLVSDIGEIIITNDGVTILSEMEIEHPAAKMLAEVAKTQEEEIGDGTTTAVILSGKLLENAEKLLDQKVHPTSIIRGYNKAAEKCQEILKKLAKKVSPKNDHLMKNVAMTAMTGKSAESSKENFANIIVKAIKQIIEYRDNKPYIDINNVKIEKRKGGGLEDSKLIEGIILNKERVHIDMPSDIKDAKIALLDAPLEIRSPENDAKISISSPEQLQAFLNREERALKEIVDIIKKANANVVFCQKGIDDIAQYYLAKEKIYAVRRVSRGDMEKLAKASGAKIVSNLKELNQKNLGFAKKVEEIKYGEEGSTYVRGCSNPKAITILIRGGTEHVMDEFERAIKDGLGDIATTIQEGHVVSGGGAIEIEVARLLRKQLILKGREQLAVEQFADALESIPKILAENAGMDPIDIITELKARHDKNEFDSGLNLFSGKIENTFKAGIVEPLKIKTQAIKSASEVANMILRIDDVIASGKNPSQGMPKNMNFPNEMAY